MGLSATTLIGVVLVLIDIYFPDKIKRFEDNVPLWGEAFSKLLGRMFGKYGFIFVIIGTILIALSGLIIGNLLFEIGAYAFVLSMVLLFFFRVFETILIIFQSVFRGRAWSGIGVIVTLIGNYF